MPMSASNSSSIAAENSAFLINLVRFGTVAYFFLLFSWYAFDIRMGAIREYGPVIHEFDPYFNWRATQYLYENGWRKFVTWFDYKVWYPLGRPVGTTIYPGMQVTAVFIKRVILGSKMSLNDICCYIPAWFGVSASILTGLMTYECSLAQTGSIFTFLTDIYRGEIRKPVFSKSYSPAVEAGVFAMGIMSLIPAHLMRSIGGGYDNESVAITAMTLTFWLWCRSLRANDEKSYLFGIATGIAYFYMVATWGGYVFVLNIIGVHAAILVALGRFSTKIYRAYSLFYSIGTILAIQVPVVGWTPLKSLEQLGPAAVFVIFQILQYCEIVRRKEKLSRLDANLLRIKATLVTIALGSIIVYTLAPTGYFGPISARVRGLFVKHTRTGNPLVDSVAEHQPASADAYFRFVHDICYIAPVGFLIVLFRLGDASSFLLVYGVAAYFFSSKMVRLVLLLGPIASSLGGIVLGRVTAWTLDQFIGFISEEDDKSGAEVQSTFTPENDKKSKKQRTTKKNLSKKEVASTATTGSDSPASSLVDGLGFEIPPALELVFKLAKCIIGGYIVHYIFLKSVEFRKYSYEMSSGLSHPTIITKGQLQNGDTVIVDDYRQAYLWLKDNTPEDARILAWWDYGYQITGISNRTTLADGNTWNHEHIALLGKILTSPEKEGHRIARHLADYALVWAGGGGDDLAKSPHLARIANSVYRDMCPGDPTCRGFGFMDQYGTPSDMMGNSFLYKLHSHNIKPGVQADPNRFKEVFSSKYGKVRIYKILAVSKESKEWVKSQENRVCDAPGSWYCTGQYPPALKKVLVHKRDFAQLEDFNKGGGKKDEDYQKAYFEKMAELKGGKKQKAPPRTRPIPQESNAQDTSNWIDNEETTMMWELINKNDVATLKTYLDSNPSAAYVRSSDGRGPLFWAYEYKRDKIAKILTGLGVSHTDKDKHGLTPRDMLERS